MTFLNEIKNELLGLKIKKQCCMESEVRGILAFGGVGFGNGALFGTESFELAKRISVFLRRVCNIDFAERLDSSAGSYKFLVPESVLEELGLIAVGELIEEKENKETDACCMRAFIRGAFLASGSAASPDKAYRVEIFTQSEKLCEKAFEIITELGVDCKKAQRKNLFVIYGNNSENASDILKVAEASMAVFKMLDAKIEKEKRNRANRLTNFDMANIDRINENSRRETDAIRLIEEKRGLDSLKPHLRTVALLRLENEGASLMELCEMVDPPLAKSTLKNRLNKLIEIAKELSDN